MKVKWSDFAQNTFFKTVDYVDENFGENARKKLVSEVRHINSLLKKQPFIGVVEPLLENAPIQFRSISVNDLNRIVYRVEDKCIEVVDFWDMRRDPDLLATRVLNRK